MSNIIVQKFGGTSVADVERIQNVAKKVVETRKKGYDVVVVVSALGDTTDRLIGLAPKLVKPKKISATRKSQYVNMGFSNCGEPNM